MSVRVLQTDLTGKGRPSLNTHTASCRLESQAQYVRREGAKHQLSPRLSASFLLTQCDQPTDALASLPAPHNGLYSPSVLSHNKPYFPQVPFLWYFATATGKVTKTVSHRLSRYLCQGSVGLSRNSSHTTVEQLWKSKRLRQNHQTLIT